jgi:hypothetical protein
VATGIDRNVPFWHATKIVRLNLNSGSFRRCSQVLCGEGEAVDAGVVGVLVLDVDGDVGVDVGECGEKWRSPSCPKLPDDWRSA